MSAVLAERVSNGFAHPVAIAAVPILCGAWLLVGFEENALTLALSILAISTTQLVLLAQSRDARAVQVKLDELIHGVPAADDTVAGIEKSEHADAVLKGEQ